MTAYVHTKYKRADGALDTFTTTEVAARQTLLGWQKAGLSYTRSGYGSKIPTSYMVNFRNKWRRVYCCIWSNSGTLYIGNFGKKTEEILIVQIDS